ncbi:hypothetical protein SISSUDRAFT_1127122 [Sistotremastrum suecicum HHB10207 ss-3]|uniref:Cep57 centrosome microtubule-binding domain-containing protein n=1 Tax=Sistotremastrum suecicum HHB10207 ss-3 TaxID=1314776 RepID=A0A166FI83_9AGAM|nr:hypothetical protein SISSUDRAFT_1127122 [Sistotremastrum suecicum HHB10207 ss-3]
MLSQRQFHDNTASSLFSLPPGGSDYEERMRLESNLDDNPHLPDFSFSNDGEVEHARHDPHPHSFRSYDSGIFQRGHDFDDGQGYTTSTAAHHASAVTLSAGLAQGRTSPSDAEYDPDRPLAGLDLRKAKREISILSHSNAASLTDALHRQKSFSPRRPTKTSQPRADKENNPPSAHKASSNSQSQSFKFPNNSAPTTPHRRVRLPDITGLTSAVSSPSKVPYSLSTHATLPSESESVQSMQTRLQAAIRESAAFRAQVEELERKLQETLEREREMSLILRETKQSHNRALDEVVKEKMGLESLVASLRFQQSRLDKALSERTSELASLRLALAREKQTTESLREEVARGQRALDAKDVLYKERLDEVRRLRQEISRLEKDCIYLRGCVERALEQAQRDATKSADNLRSLKEFTISELSAADLPDVSEAPRRHDLSVLVERTEPSATTKPEMPSRNTTPTPSSRSTSRLDVTKTRATFGGGSTRTRFIDETELSRVQSDIDERRSEASQGSRSQDPFDLPSAAQSPRDDLDKGTTYPTTNPIPLAGPSGYVHTPGGGHRPAKSMSERVLAGTKPPTPQPNAQRDRHEEAPTTPTSRQEPLKPETPFPQIRGRHMERLFFTVPEHDAARCSACHRKKRTSSMRSERLDTPQWLKQANFLDDGVQVRPPDRNIQENVQARNSSPEERRATKEQGGSGHNDQKLPPQTVLARVLRELEDDFAHYKEIYIELAEQYKHLDAACNVAKRHVLAEHLVDVVKTLDRKGGQISRLYELLNFKDQDDKNPRDPNAQ